MTLPNRQLFWIARLRKRRAGNRLVRASGARSAAGRRAGMTCGLVAAASFGTRSTQEEFAPPVFTSGLRPSASRVSSGRRTRSGMRPDACPHFRDLLNLGNQFSQIERQRMRHMPPTRYGDRAENLVPFESSIGQLRKCVDKVFPVSTVLREPLLVQQLRPELVD